MAETRDLLVRIKGDTAGFEKSMNQVKGSSDEAHNSFGRLTSAVALGNIIANAATNVFQGLASAVTDTVKKTEDLGLSTSKLMRETGMTAEQSSGLLAVFERFGIDAAGASKDLGLFAKQIVAAGQAAVGSTNTFTNLGIKVKDSNGNLKDTQTVLLEVADKFKTMPDGVQKTADAMALFGKSGKDMLPILNQGSEGIAELEAHAAKMGVVLSLDNVNAIRANMRAHKDLQEAVTGLQLKVGTALMPTITALTVKLTEFVTSDKFQAWLKQATTWIQANLPKAINFLVHDVLPVMVQVFKSVIKVLEDLGKFYEHHKKLIDALIPVVIGLVAAMIAMKAVNSVINTVKMAWAALSLVMEASPIILIIAAVIAAGILLVTHWSQVKKVAEDVWHSIAGFFTGLWHDVVRIWDGIRDGIVHSLEGAVKFVAGIPGAILHGLGNLGSLLFNAGKDLINGLINGATSLLSSIGKFFLDKVPGFIREPFKKALGISSPSKVFAEFGKNITQGLADGVSSSAHVVQSAIGGLGGVTVDAGDSSASQLVQSTLSSPAAVAPVSITVAPNIGMYAGMPSERREIAVQLWQDLVKMARAQGVQLPNINVAGLQT